MFPWWRAHRDRRGDPHDRKRFTRDNLPVTAIATVLLAFAKAPVLLSVLAVGPVEILDSPSKLRYADLRISIGKNDDIVLTE